MPPKDEILFGATEIYLDGEKVTKSNPFGFSLGEKQANDELMSVNETFSFSGSVELTENVRELLKPKDHYNLVCSEIDGLKYTFTDGEDTITFTLSKMTKEYEQIKIGTECSFRYT